MLRLKFFFLGALIAGLKGFESFLPVEGKLSETFPAGLSPARVYENYYDNQARAIPVEEGDDELRVWSFEEPEAQLSFDQAQRMDESYMRRRRNPNGSSYDRCVDEKFEACLATGNLSARKCGTQARQECRK